MKELLQEFGIDHLIKNCITFEPHRSPAFKGKLVMRLKEQKLGQQNPETMMEGVDPERRERMLAQMPSDISSISCLERYFTRDQAVEMMEAQLKSTQ